MSHSKSARKPDKPYPDFPLFAHATHRWAKKIRGKIHYFGPWDDPQAALQKYLDQRDDLQAGRTPRGTRKGLAIRDLLNQFLTSKFRLVEAGEIVRRTLDNYKATGDHVVACFGRTRLVEDLAAEDFGKLRSDLAKRYGPQALAAEIQRVRAFFKFAYDGRLIEHPVPFGHDFRLPGKRLMREARQAKGLKMFEAAEIRTILDAVPVQLKAMTLLGINAGLGNHDCGQLTFKALDLEKGWLTFPRAKTGIMRRVPLWPETIAAIREAVAERREPKAPADRDVVFLTRLGLRWVRLQDKVKRVGPNADGKVWIDSIAYEFQKRITKLGIKRPGLCFYGLRHTFATVAEETKDFPAVEAIMGHSDLSMAGAYREKISDDRLRAVAEHVRKWLFAKEEQG
jgi:integrase